MGDAAEHDSGDSSQSQFNPDNANLHHDINDANQALDGQITAVYAHFRLPSFVASNPTAWFHQIEVLFKARRISSELARYSYLVEALPFDVITAVEDLLEKIPEPDPYTQLKTAILQRVAKSSERKLRELFTTLELGDERPSTLLRKMRSCLDGRAMSDDILRRLWLDKLPSSLQHVLATCDPATALNQLAQTADRIMDVFPSSSHYASVHHTSVQQPRSTTSPSPEPRSVNVCHRRVSPTSEVSRGRSASRHEDFQDLKETIKLLCAQMNTMNATINRLQADRDSRSRRRSQSRGRSTSQLCWYHQSYGPKAKKCIPPCDYNKSRSGNTNASE